MGIAILRVDVTQSSPAAASSTSSVARVAAWIRIKDDEKISCWQNSLARSGRIRAKVASNDAGKGAFLASTIGPRGSGCLPNFETSDGSLLNNWRSDGETCEKQNYQRAEHDGQVVKSKMLQVDTFQIVLLLSLFVLNFYIKL